MQKLNPNNPSDSSNTSNALNTETTTRRTFLCRTAATVAAFQIVPGYVLGLNGETPPSQKLNVADIGIGGMGRNNPKKGAGEKITALRGIHQEAPPNKFHEYPHA